MTLHIYMLKNQSIYSQLDNIIFYLFTYASSPLLFFQFFCYTYFHFVLPCANKLNKTPFTLTTPCGTAWTNASDIINYYKFVRIFCPF